MAAMLEPLNSMLVDPTSGEYTTAAAAAVEATSCRNAVERLGLLAVLDPDDVSEADAVFAAMPAEVDQGILGALRAGFGRGSSIELHWEIDRSEGEPTVAVRIDKHGDRLHVHVIAPHGRRFLQPN